MDLAVRTSASPAAIWAICVVAVLCLAFWLIMIMYADRHPYVRQGRLPEMTGSVLGGIHLAAGGRSVAPTRDSSAVASEDYLMSLAAERLAGSGRPEQEEATAGAPEPAAQEAGRPLVPGPRGPQAAAPTEPIPAQPTSPDDTPAHTERRG